MAPVSEDYPLVVVGRMGDHAGYDLLTVRIAEQLHRAGVPIRCKILNNYDPPGWMRPLCRWNVHHGWEMHVGPPDRLKLNPATANVAFTMWEAGRLSGTWIRDLSLHTRLAILPCEWCMTVFDSAGVGTDLTLVPLGHDPDSYRPEKGPPAVVTFGAAASLGSGGKRKNVEQTVRCFRAAFVAGEAVRLRIKLTPRCEFDLSDDGRISLTRADLTVREMCDWYNSLTALVNTSHAEGFGLHMLEAMACGRPLVSARFGGVAEYLTAENGYPVPYALVPARSDHKLYRGLWSECGDAAVVAAMRRVYESPEEAARKGLAAAGDAGRLTWGAMGGRLRQALLDHGVAVAPESVRGGEPLPRPVTVVVLTWNAYLATRGYVESFTECPLPANVDWLFVDNGSTDQTIPLLRAWRVPVIRNPANVGYTRAANQGMRGCTGDVVLMNNDTAVLQTDWLARLQETAYSSPDIGVVGCRLVGAGGEVSHCGGAVNENMEGRNVRCGPGEYPGVHDFPYVTFACVYIKRSTIEKLGLLDEDFFAYYDDTDYCFRARRAGLRVVADGRVVVMHTENTSGRANGVDLGELVRKSHRTFASKWGWSAGT